MKSLSRLVQEAVDHAYWQSEVERTAVSFGCVEPGDVESTWQAVCEVVDSISSLAFDYRHQNEEFVPVLREWYADHQIRLRVSADMRQNHGEMNSENPRDLTLTNVLWRLLGKVETAYEQYELSVQSKIFLSQIEPPKLSDQESEVAKDVARHLQKALMKVKLLQKSMRTPSFEFDIYQNIIEASKRHFEEMSDQIASPLEEAA